MRWKHLLPFDRFTLDGPISAVDAVSRLKANTAYIPYGGPRPPERAFDGKVWSTGFDITIWPRKRGWFIDRNVEQWNMSRPVCKGTIGQSESGCHIKITLRPRIVELAVFALLVCGLPSIIIDAWQSHGDDGVVIFAVGGCLFSAVAYAGFTSAFWKMRDRTVRSLVDALHGQPAARPEVKPAE